MTGGEPRFLENEEFAARIPPTLRGSKRSWPTSARRTWWSPARPRSVGDETRSAQIRRVSALVGARRGFTLREYSGHRFYIDDPGRVGHRGREHDPEILLKSRHDGAFAAPGDVHRLLAASAGPADGRAGQWLPGMKEPQVD